MTQLPSKQQILDWIKDNPTRVSKREIGRAFGIKGAGKIDLKRMLRELTDEGHLEKHRRTFRDPDSLPPVSVVKITDISRDGDIWAKVTEWPGDGPPPRILFVPKTGDPAVRDGDRLLCRLSKSAQEDVEYEARLIRRIGRSDSSLKIVGIYRTGSQGGRIVPVDKKNDKEWRVGPDDAGGARDGELVEAHQTGPKSRMGLPSARIVDVLGDPSAPKAISLIAIHHHGIPDVFEDDTLSEAEAAKPTGLGDRTDLRDLPLFTIDPADARDHDDAICASPDPDPKNEGGHIVWVAIADVAHYVRPGSALDREARKRGNSSYFPDRVVPMLPDALSGDLCSLHMGVDRPCMAVRMVLNSKGVKLSHEFHRAMMRSPASLSYEQAQAAHEGRYDEMTEPLAGPIRDLFAAYSSAVKARNARQPLNLDLPERKIVLAADGHVASVDFADRFDAHKLVEEFMIAANVCAAETLEGAGFPQLYRVHEEPSPEKLDALRETAEASGLVLAKGQVLKTQHLNKLLDAAAGTEDSEIINMTVLRSMTQAYYAPVNFGHFGLNLKRYAHFTSPIRRYADLIVHRALISAHGWGGDGLSDSDRERLKETGEWISTTERRSMLAERDTTDRYLAAFLADHVGNAFSGRISGIARFGLFVKLDDSGADGIVPLSSLGREYWRYDERNSTLKGEDSGRVIGLGMRCKVELLDAVAVTGGLTLQLLELEGKELPQGGRGSRGKSGRKKYGKARAKSRADKAKRKRRT